MYTTVHTIECVDNKDKKTTLVLTWFVRVQQYESSGVLTFSNST